MSERLAPAEWRRRRDEHARRVAPWVRDRVGRAGAGAKHPVWDFLFEYYAFRPAYLRRWSPGLGVVCEGMTSAEADWPAWAVAVDGGAAYAAGRLSASRRRTLDWAVDYLEAVGAREPLYGCFGLHEWAMVYRDPSPRHRVPLRLAAAGTDAVVESGTLRCTHFDAYRFFTPDAAPRNRHALTREASRDFDQPGCVHVTMDLYKFAFVLAPLTPAELAADCFELAAEARALDMRASPYDLSGLGFAPIRVETKEGREEYVAGQKRLAAKAAPLRARVLAAYREARGDSGRPAPLSGC